MDGTCELCERLGRFLTFHHLIPRRCHRNKRFRRQFTRLEMRDRSVWPCKECHCGIHDLLPDKKMLGWNYNTRDLLLAHVGVSKHVDGSGKRNDALLGHGTVKPRPIG
jgi:hypothetical protein